MNKTERVILFLYLEKERDITFIQDGSESVGLGINQKVPWKNVFAGRCPYIPFIYTSFTF